MKIKMRSETPMRIAKTGYIVMSIVFCAVGIVFMVIPEVFIDIIGKIFGGALMVFGLIKLVGYFSKDLFRLAFQYDLEFGIVLLILGAAVLLRPSDVMDFLFIAMGVAVLMDGLFKIRIALDAKRFGISQWWYILFFAVAADVVGLLVMFRPWDSMRVLTLLLGVSLFTEGILNLAVALSTVKIVKNQYPDMVDGETEE